MTERQRHSADRGANRDAVSRARDALTLIRRCSATLGRGLCSDPGWSILLDLFVADADSRRLSVSALCIDCGAAPATGLRYITQLSEAGLVERVADERDGRRWYVFLTDQGRSAMLDLLR